MVSSGQAFNSLSYCMQGMEPSEAATCCSCLSACSGPPSWCIPWEKEMLGRWGRMVCSNGWRSGACPVAEGLVCSSSMPVRWQQRKAKFCFCKPSAAFVPGRHVVITVPMCVVPGCQGPVRWQLTSCHAGELFIPPGPGGGQTKADSPLGWGGTNAEV